MSHEEFFKDHGMFIVQQVGESDWFTIEDLFQAFKSRLMAEVVVEVAPMHFVEEGIGSMLVHETCPLIDKPEEL